MLQQVCGGVGVNTLLFDGGHAIHSLTNVTIYDALQSQRVCLRVKSKREAIPSDELRGDRT